MYYCHLVGDHTRIRVSSRNCTCLTLLLPTYVHEAIDCWTVVVNFSIVLVRCPITGITSRKSLLLSLCRESNGVALPEETLVGDPSLLGTETWRSANETLVLTLDAWFATAVLTAFCSVVGSRSIPFIAASLSRQPRRKVPIAISSIMFPSPL
jgi:hypothetical protein